MTTLEKRISILEKLAASLPAEIDVSALFDPEASQEDQLEVMRQLEAAHPGFSERVRLVYGEGKQAANADELEPVESG